MCNVAINYKIIIAASLALGVLSACSSSDKEKAETLYAQAQECMGQGRYDEAMGLLDSMDHTYPAEVEIRRKGMHLRPKLIEQTTLNELSKTDSLLAVTQLKSDSIAKYISKVDNPIEPYYVAADFKGKDVTSSPGLYARITPEGQFYMLLSLNKPVHCTSVMVAMPDGVSASTSVVPYDGERNDRQDGCEVITFMQAECDTIGALVSKNADAKFTLTFNGDKSYSMPLPESQLKGIATMYEAASLLRNLKVYQIRKTHLEKQLELARNQQARTYNEENQGNE